MVNPLFSNLDSIFIIKLVAAIAILSLGYIAARFSSRLIHKILHELETDRVLEEQAGFKVPLEEFLSQVAKYLIYFIAIIVALNHLGLTTTILQILLIVALIILIAFAILAFKDFIPNVFAGFLIHQKKKVKPGDFIRVKNIEGIVIHVNLTETRVKTKKREIIYIPNSILLKNEVIKRSK